MSKKPVRPPYLAKKLLSFMRHYSEEYSSGGDLVEEYKEIAKEKGKCVAYLWYWWQVLYAIPTYILLQIEFGGAMFKNIMKLAFRNLLKNKLFSFISIVGLSLAIGCFIVSYAYVDFWNSMDSFHENVDEIFMVESVINRSGNTQVYGTTPMPLGPSLIEDFPQIKRVVRINGGWGSFRYKERVFGERFLFVDEEFFDMFTFPLLTGNKDALKDKNSVIVSDKYAEKYFGTEDPIGKELLVSRGEEYQQSFFVKGVVKNNPKNSSIRFDILLPYEKRLDWGVDDLCDWSIRTNATFIQLENPDDVNVLKNGMNKYVNFQNSVERDWSVSEFDFEPVSKISDNSWKIRNSIGHADHPAAIIAIFLFGLLLLLIACLNYANIGIVTATRRLKEIGIRKVLGSTRSKLVHQFMGENLLLCLIAAIVGIALAKFYLFPSFVNITSSPAEMNLSGNYKLWLYFVMTLLITGVGVGGYPALYVSRFHPVSILRKTQKVGGGKKFAQALLLLQFVFTFITIATSILVWQNSIYQKNMDWGYNQEHVIGVRLDGEKHFELYKNVISKNPNILGIAGSQNHIGDFYSSDTVFYEGNKYEITRFSCGYDYLQTMQFRLKEGRTFDKNLATDLDNSIIINEKFATSMGWEQPLNKSVVIGTNSYFVIGVVEDFHYRTFMSSIGPAMFRLCDKNDFNYLLVRSKAGAETQTAKTMEECWKAAIPDEPYNAFFQDDIWGPYFRELNATTTIFSFIAVIAIVISCMGLFGLITINIVKRMKELSIRKVFGASVGNIVNLFNKNLFTIMIVSTIIATPICYFLADSLLGSVYRYRPPIKLFPFLIAGLLMTTLSLLTVLSQIYKAARSNPADTLRIE
jgi:putative ABC transport system permease protein